MQTRGWTVHGHRTHRPELGGREADDRLTLDDLRWTAHAGEVLPDVVPCDLHRLVGALAVVEDADAEPTALAADEVVGDEPRDAADQPLDVVAPLLESVDQRARILVVPDHDVRHGA